MPRLYSQFHLDHRSLLRRQRNLGLNHRFANRLHRLRVAPQIEIQLAADVIECDSDEQVVNVVAAQVRVTVGGDDLEDAFVQLEHRDVKSPAAQVVDRYNSIPL